MIKAVWFQAAFFIFHILTHVGFERKLYIYTLSQSNEKSFLNVLIWRITQKS